MNTCGITGVLGKCDERRGDITGLRKLSHSSKDTTASLLHTSCVSQGVFPELNKIQEAGITTSTQTIQSTEATPIGWSSLGEACRKGGGHTAFNWGNFRCIVIPAPGPPLSRVLTELGRAPGLQILRGCGLWKGGQVCSTAGQVQARPFLSLGRPWTPLSISLTLRRPYC